MASLERERCPDCAAIVWYPTDRLGRVIAWCDPCGKPAARRPTDNDPALVRRQMAAATQLHARQRLDVIYRQIVETPNVSTQQLVDMYGLTFGKDAVNKALYRLMRDGAVDRVALSRLSGRPRYYYFPTANAEGAAVARARTREEEVLDLLTGDTTRWWVPLAVAKATKIPSQSIYTILSKLYIRGLVQRRKGPHLTEYAGPGAE